MYIEQGPSRLLTESEAAYYLKLSRSTLRQQRMQNRPVGRLRLIPFIRIGRNIRYDVRDLDAWITRQKGHGREPG
ncbi:MAG: helix-turn-helix domain-containing protein [Gammaproteobacteria bacterium]